MVVGSANVDLAASVTRLPSPGETVMGGALERSAGGKGANQAIAARRAGVRVHLLAAIGTRDPGDWLVQEIRAQGIGVEHIVRPDGPPGTALVVTDDGGENQIVVCPGANAQAGADLLERVQHLRPDVVLVQCEIPEKTVAAALRHGRKIGAVTIVNAAPATPFALSVIGFADVAVVNEHEYASLLGRPFVETARRAPGSPAMVVTLGGRGAAILDGDRPRFVPAPRVEVVDSVAAGDAFCGVLAASLAQRHPLDEAVRRGCVAGAVTVTRRGAARALPSGAELARAIATQA